MMFPFLVSKMSDVGALEIVKNITEQATSIAGGFATIGKGIGAIMLLVVVGYYIYTILDGAEFKVRMLLPILIFLFVCNFNWISTPVIAFTNTLSSSLMSSCNAKASATRSQLGGNDTANYKDMCDHSNSEPYDPNVIAEATQSDSAKDNTDDTVTDSTLGDVAAQQPKERRGFVARMVKKGVKSSAVEASLNIQAETSNAGFSKDGKGPGNKPKQQNLTFLSVVSSIVSWLVTLYGNILSVFGGLMTGIIIAFGPITFAFAIFPGQNSTIKTWFIRLCQFSLYAPITALINAFSVSIFASMPYTSNMLWSIIMALCNLVALTSVPTIASMIIEGASGAVSLSSGLQTMAHGIGTVAGVAGAGVTAAAGKNNMVSSFNAGLKERGVSGAVKAFKDNGFAGGFKNLLDTGRSVQGRSSAPNSMGGATGGGSNPTGSGGSASE